MHFRPGWLSVLLTTLFSTNLMAQVILKPSIGLTELPADSNQICEIPLRLGGGFDTLGYNISDTIPDFTLYDHSGQPFNLKSTLEIGKPVLLVVGSYTCPVFRNHLNELNELQAMFGEEVTIRIVYTVEAHPDTDISPYYGYVNVSQQNLLEGVFYRQPTTYGERRQLVDTMLKNLVTDVPVLIDGPCNNFWVNFQCGPNTAYLIRPDGVIFSKHGWFNQPPENMANDINLLLGNGNGQDSATYDGHFQIELTDDPNVHTEPGTTAYIHATLKNSDLSSGVQIDLVKKLESYPEGWNTSLCSDVCYSPTVDSATLYLAPGASQLFTLDFYTTDAEDSGSVVVIFRNHYSSDEEVQQLFKVSTMLEQPGQAKAYPNPTYGEVEVVLNNNLPAGEQLNLYDLAGKRIVYFPLTSDTVHLNLTNLPSGVYILKAGDQAIKIMKL